MITLLLAPLPIALSLAAPSLPEVPSVVLAIALVLLPPLAMALVSAALVVAMAGTVNTVSSSARKQQVIGMPTIGLTPQQNFTLGGTVNRSSQSNAFFNNKYDKN
ncbi:hypothetical protein [Shewanella sp. SR44-3]|uniref:hypothetical protein n=1 Tax=Shewanella sp. SR44-3 TaxID=2760936 RepID=UPI0015FBE0A3|nr:hypothetical protein [Shewanella sp. SR44-3]MBB1268637.1 hypothetical protein [Shewanella sp. SR44-3]